MSIFTGRTAQLFPACVNARPLCAILKKLLIIFIIVFCCSKSRAQWSISVNDVIEDTTNMYGYDFMDSSFEINPITESESDIEIRLYEWAMHGSKCEIISLTQGQWQGKVIGISSYAKESSKILDTTLIMITVLDTLNRNNIFKLPDQSFLTLKGSADDGVSFLISYKFGRKFRSYKFSNPDYYFEMNKEVKELKNYLAIIKTFDNIFKAP